MMKRIWIVVAYLWAVLLVFLVPVMFFSFGSGLPQKWGSKIPIKEGTFKQDGTLQSSDQAK